MSERNDGGRFVQIPGESFGALRRALVDAVGPSEAGHVLRLAGAESAAAFERLLAERMDRAGSLGASPNDAFWAALDGALADFGWGTLSRSKPHPGVLALESGDWAEAADAVERQPVCHFTTGLLGGLLHSVAGQELAVLEVECRAAGQPACRFLVGHEETLRAIHGGLAEGGAAGEVMAGLG